MTIEKKKAQRFVTPVGIAVYPHLIVADTKFNTEGVFVTELTLKPTDVIRTDKGAQVSSVQIFLDAENTRAFEDKAATVVGKKDKKGKPIVVTEADAPYRIDDAGNIIVKFKLNAAIKFKDTDGTVKEVSQRPALFDAKGSPIEPDALWGGSKLKISFEVIDYLMESTKTAGISLRLKAVQVIELVKGGGASADGFGFAEEEGYEAPVTDSASSGFGVDDEGDQEGDF